VGHPERKEPSNRKTVKL